MNLELLLQQAAIFLTIWSPVWAFIIWHIKLNGRKWCLLTSFLLLGCTVYFGFYPLHIPNLTFWLGYYSLFLLVYILLLLPKYGIKQFNKILAVSILLLFIAGDSWELPVFVYDFVTKAFGFQFELFVGGFSWLWLASHVRRVYTLASFVLLTQLTHITVSWKFLSLILGATTVLTMPILLVWNGWFLGTVARLVGLYGFGILAYAGLPDIEASA